MKPFCPPCRGGSPTARPHHSPTHPLALAWLALDSVHPVGEETHPPAMEWTWLMSWCLVCVLHRPVKLSSNDKLHTAIECWLQGHINTCLSSCQSAFYYDKIYFWGVCFLKCFDLLLLIAVFRFLSLVEFFKMFFGLVIPTFVGAVF